LLVAVVLEGVGSGGAVLVYSIHLLPARLYCVSMIKCKKNPSNNRYTKMSSFCTILCTKIITFIGLRESSYILSVTTKLKIDQEHGILPSSKVKGANRDPLWFIEKAATSNEDL